MPFADVFQLLPGCGTNKSADTMVDVDAGSWLCMKLAGKFKVKDVVSASRITVSVFLIGYLYAGSVWLFPDWTWRPGNGLVCAFLKYIGLWQGYRLFSNPNRANVELYADIRFDDGTHCAWHFPRTAPERADNPRLFRLRKYGFGYLMVARNGYLRADFAKFLARLHNTSDHHPVEVSLKQAWAAIPPPAAGHILAGREPYSTRAVYVFPITADDLL